MFLYTLYELNTAKYSKISNFKHKNNMQNNLKTELEFLEVIAESHNLRLNRVKDFRRARLIKLAIEIKVNNLLRTLDIKQHG